MSNSALALKPEPTLPPAEPEILDSIRRPASADWLTTKQAAAYLSMTYSSFISSLSDGELPYYGLKWKSRSPVKSTSRRGCGVLWLRSDLDDVIRLRRAMKRGTKPALTVFQMLRKGVLTFAEEPTTEEQS